MPKRANGRVLTVKALSPRCYKAIHLLPRGYRQDSIRALLGAAADLAVTNPDWYKDAVAGRIKIVVGGR